MITHNQHTSKHDAPGQITGPRHEVGPVRAAVPFQQCGRVFIAVAMLLIASVAQASLPIPDKIHRAPYREPNGWKLRVIHHYPDCWQTLQFTDKQDRKHEVNLRPDSVEATPEEWEAFIFSLAPVKPKVKE